MNIDYIAGFFDGEGTITFTKNRARITISQTNKEVLEEIQNFFGFGNILEIKKRKQNWKDAWMYYTCNTTETVKIAEQLINHIKLKEKLEKLKIVISEYYLNQSLKNARKLKIEESIKMAKEGISYRDIEKITGISRTTICNNLK